MRDDSIKLRFSFPLLIWGTTSFFYFYQFIIRVSPSVTAAQIMQDLSIQACSMGMLASTYYAGYTGMQIAVGIILDRIGVRYPLAIASLLCVGGCLLFASSDSLIVMGIGRFFMGVGSSIGLLSCVKSASVWFSPRVLPTLIGWTMLMGPFGGAVGGAPFASLVSVYGWRGAILVLALAGFVVAVMAWMFVRDKTEITVQEQPRVTILESLIIILQKPQTYLYGLYGCLMYIPLSGFVDLWGVPYMMHTYGLDEVKAAGFVSQIYIGVGVGGPLGAWVLAQVKRYKPVLLAGAFLSGLMFLISIYAPVDVMKPVIMLPGFITFRLLDILFLAAGLFATVQFYAFACVVAINADYLSGTASGVHNMACMLSGIIFQPVIGWLLDLSWDGTLLDGAPVYREADYLIALIAVPLSLILATITGFFLKEVYPRE
ncbi:MAG: MFS transporter [Pseudomonadota bacterium]